MFVILGLAAVWAIGVFWGGYVTSVLWTWFAVPLGVVHITYWHAAGLSALLGVFLGSRGLAHPSETRSAGDEVLTAGIFAVLIPFLGLVSGWVAHVNM